MSDETLKEQIEQALQKDFNNLLVKEFTTDWKIQRLKIGLDIEVMDFDNLMQLIKQDRERAVKEARVDELKSIALVCWDLEDGEDPNDAVAIEVEHRIADLQSTIKTNQSI